MALSKKIIWEQVSTESADSRIQRAFEMLLGEEFGLFNNCQQGTAIDQHFLKGYNRINEKTANIRRDRHIVEGIKKVDS